MREKFRQQLEEMYHQMVVMGGLCQQAIAVAVKTLEEEEDTAENLEAQVFALDGEIDDMEREIEGMCTKLLLRQQPVAKDLRRITAALKMVTDLERIGDQAADNAPLEDVSRAVRYITEHAEQFHVQPEDYAVLAYSSGGQIAGLFASDSDTLGYKAYGVSKPGALLLGYPVNNFFELKPVWGLLIDPYADGPRYFDYNVSDYITPDYPPVYHWYGKNDVTLAKMYTPAQGRVIEKALVKNGVPHIFHHYHNAPHKIGPGRGTDAEGWITEAVAFWESQTAAKAADTAA